MYSETWQAGVWTPRLTALAEFENLSPVILVSQGQPSYDQVRFR